MNTKFTFFEKLQSYVGSNRLIEIDRSPLSKENMWGFVAYAGESFVVLNIVSENFFLNGFTIIRTNDIRRYKIVEDREDMIRYVLSQRYSSKFLEQFSIDSDELHDFSFLKTIHKYYPLVTILREEMDETICSIGRIEELKNRIFLLRELSTTAQWEGVRRFRYSDVTRIDVGGKYEEGLWMYASQ